jgi:hypothetical protein
LFLAGLIGDPFTGCSSTDECSSHKGRFKPYGSSLMLSGISLADQTADRIGVYKGKNLLFLLRRRATAQKEIPIFFF